MQLEIEQNALKKEKDPASKERLGKIEKQLAELRAWLWELDADDWDRQMKRDAEEGKLDLERCRALIERGLQLCRDRGAVKLVWETAPDNATSHRLYDGIGAAKSTWLSYELDA